MGRKITSNILVVSQQCIHLERKFTNNVNKHNPRNASRENHLNALALWSRVGNGEFQLSWFVNGIKDTCLTPAAAVQSPVLSKL